VELYPYQEEGVKFLVERKRALLLDAPGLGKTAQAIRAAEALGAVRVLVVCPNVVKWQWVDEVGKWTPGRYALVCDQGREGAESFAVCAPLNKYNVIHWAALRLLPDSFFKLHWDVLIADEVHYACNKDAQRTRLLKRVKAEYKWGLTATPYRNWVCELWSILHWLDKKKWSSYWRFFNEYMVYVDTEWGRDIMGERDLDYLAAELDGTCLQRTKKEVAPWLPPLTTTYLPIGMTDEQRRSYKLVREELVVDDKFVLNPLQRTTELRKATCDARVAATKELLDTLVGPVIVFTNFVYSAGAAVLQFGGSTRAVYCITGRSSEKARRFALAQFRDSAMLSEDWDVPGPVLIMTLGVGGTGLDLDEADTVVFTGAAWDSVLMEQALERIHRVNSTRPKHAYYIACKGTLDEVVLWAVESKKDRRACALAAIAHVKGGE
jgi:SNF2 family DNA or RNA helicase